MKFIRISIILIALLFLFSCVKAPTGLASYEEILEYENKTISDYENFKEADEPDTPSMQTSGENDPFRIAVNHNVNDCFAAGTVGAAGDSFTLTTDINLPTTGDCVILNLSDIVFDCDGFEITGAAGMSDDGIYVNNVGNITIKNCEISGFAFANDTGGGVYDFSYGITIGRIALNVTIINTTIHDINPVPDEGGGGIRFNSQWPAFPAFLNLSNVTVYNSNNGVRIGSRTLACLGGPCFMQGPFITRDCNFSDNTHFQYVAYNTEGNHLITNTEFRALPGVGAATNERTLQITGNRTVFNTNGEYLENITIQNCNFTGGVFNYSDIFISRASNVTIENSFFEKNIFITNSTNVSILGNTFADNDTVNLSFNSIYVNTVENLTIAKNFNVPEMFDLNNVVRGFIRDNTFVNNGRIRVYEITAGTNQNIVIHNNTFENMSLQGQTAAGIFCQAADANITFNNMLRGTTYSIQVINNTRVVNNQINDTIGTAFKIRGSHNYIFNNTIQNHTGTVFWINGSNNDFIRNDMVFILKYMNTSLNFDATGPYPRVPEASFGFLLLNTNATNISSNTIGILNPLSLINGVYGIKTTNTTKGPLAALAVSTQNILVVNNTFGLPSVSNFGVKTAVYLESSFNGIIENNTFLNCEHEGIVIDAGEENNLTANNISQINANRVPYYSENAVKIFRSFNNRLANNTIINYDTGILCYNSTFDIFKDNNINFSSRHGIFLFQCLNATLSSNVIFNATSGIKLFFSNLTSLIGNIVNQTVFGFDFNRAFNNTISTNIQENSTIGLNLDLFSGNNTFNNNDFTKNTDVDVLYDMFAKNNTGAGNTYATSRSENYAAGNLI